MKLDSSTIVTVRTLANLAAINMMSARVMSTPEFVAQARGRAEAFKAAAKTVVQFKQIENEAKGLDKPCAA